MRKQGKHPVERGSSCDLTSHDAHLAGLGKELLEAEALTPRTPEATGFPEGELIREGGQGFVYAGYQESLRRRVAIKIPKRGDLAAFFREGEILARLEHPNIVPAYHQVIEDDQPKLVMRYMEGEPWDVVLRRDRAAEPFSLQLHLRRHLPTLISVCNAVGYAHSRGIAHCDLKPSNVSLGGFGDVCLLDWGLAVDFGAAGEVRRRGGTPGYMAPEQELGDRCIGPHTDIYQLGAILERLLIGEKESPGGPEGPGRPGEAAITSSTQPLKDLAGQAMSPAPDARPASVEEFRAGIELYLLGSGNRERSMALLSQAKAMPPAGPNYDGYSKLDGLLSESLLAWPGNEEAREAVAQLNHEWAEAALRAGDLLLARVLAAKLPMPQAAPLTLRIDSAQKKLVRQRRFMLGLAAGVAASLVVIALVSWGAFRQRLRAAELDRSLASESHLREIAELRAREQASRVQVANRIAALLEGERSLGEELARVAPLPHSLTPTPGVDAGDAAGPLMARRQSLAAERRRLVELLGAELPPEPSALVTAAACMALENARTPDELKAALELFEGALRTRPDLEGAKVGSAICLFRLGRFQESASILLEMSASDALNDAMPGAPDLALLELTAGVLQELGDDQMSRRLYTQAASILEESWSERGRKIADISLKMGEYEESIRFANAAIGADDGDGARSSEAWWILGRSHLLAGRPVQARAAFEELLQICRAKHGESHPFTTFAYGSIAATFTDEGRSGDAEKIFLSIMPSLERIDPAEFPEVFDILNHRASNLAALARHEEAASLLAGVLDMRRVVQGPEHPSLVPAMNNLSLSLSRCGRGEEAAVMALDAINLAVRVLGEGHHQVLKCHSSFALATYVTNDMESALRAYEGLEEATRAHLGASHPDSINVAGNIAAILSRLGRHPEAVDVCRSLFSTIQHSEKHHIHRAQVVNTLEILRGLEAGQRHQELAFVAELDTWLMEDYRHTQAVVPRSFLVNDLLWRHSLLYCVLPSHLPATRPLLRRAFAIASLVDLRQDSVGWDTIRTYAGKLGLDLHAEPLPPIPDTLADGIASGVRLDDVLAWLDTAAPDIDWTATLREAGQQHTRLP